MRAGEYIRSLRSPVFTGAIQISILLYFTYFTLLCCITDYLLVYIVYICHYYFVFIM